MYNFGKRKKSKYENERSNDTSTIQLFIVGVLQINVSYNAECIDTY